MTYEYLSILLVEDGEYLSSVQNNHLNNYFDEGWEYVDSITPSVSAGEYARKGAVMVIIKKIKNVLPE